MIGGRLVSSPDLKHIISEVFWQDHPVSGPAPEVGPVSIRFSDLLKGPQLLVYVVSNSLTVGCATAPCPARTSGCRETGEADPHSSHVAKRVSFPHIRQTLEPMHVQALLPKALVERFNADMIGRLAWPREGQGDRLAHVRWQEARVSRPRRKTGSQNHPCNGITSALGAPVT